MTKEEQPASQIRIQASGGGSIEVNDSTVNIAGRDINNIVVIPPAPPPALPSPSPPTPPNLLTKCGQFLEKHKSAFGGGIVGVVLLCILAIYPLLPLVVNLVAENISSSPFFLLILASLGVSCFEIVPLLFGVLFGRWTGFFVGFVGILLGGLVANWRVALDYSANIQVLSRDQLPWIGFLVGYSLLIGGAAFLTGRKVDEGAESSPLQPSGKVDEGTKASPLQPDGKANKKTKASLLQSGMAYVKRSPWLIRSIVLLCAVGVYFLIALLFSQVTLASSVLYPLLAVSDQAQDLRGAIVMFALLFGPAILLIPIGSFLIQRTNSVAFVHKRSWRFGTLITVAVILAIPLFYQFRNMQAASTVLQDQGFPWDIPFTCNTCNYPSFRVTLDNIENHSGSSQWDITLTNPGHGSCIEVAVLSQNVTLTDAFFRVYQPKEVSGVDSQRTIRLDPGRSGDVSLLYQLVPRPAQHLRFAFALLLAPCPGTRSTGDVIQGSQVLLFQ